MALVAVPVPALGAVKGGAHPVQDAAAIFLEGRLRGGGPHCGMCQQPPALVTDQKRKPIVIGTNSIRLPAGDRRI